MPDSPTAKAGRDVTARLKLLEHFGMNLEGKNVLDVGSNAGFMLLANRDSIRSGVGLEVDPVRVNEATLGAEALGADHVKYYQFNANPAHGYGDFQCHMRTLFNGRRPDVVFLFAVAAYIDDLVGLLGHVSSLAPELAIELNKGGKGQGHKDAIRVGMSALHNLYHNVIELTNFTACTDCRGGNGRRLFYCSQPKAIMPSSPEWDAAACSSIPGFTMPEVISAPSSNAVGNQGNGTALELSLEADATALITKQSDFGYAVGLHPDPARTNGNRLHAARVGAERLHFYTSDATKEPLETVKDFLPKGHNSVKQT